jgi:hypothetical protein
MDMKTVLDRYTRAFRGEQRVRDLDTEAMATDLAAAESRLALVEPLVDEAKRWWISLRPIACPRATHLENPTLNCTTFVEDDLAKRVAAVVAAEFA